MLDQLLAGYPAPDDRYDELLARPGQPRRHWDAFTRATPFPFPVDIPASGSGVPVRIVAAVADQNPAIRPSRETAQTAREPAESSLKSEI